MNQGKLVAIAVRTESRAPMVEVPGAKVTTEAGVAADFRGKPGPRQVTVLAIDAWHAACKAVGNEEIPWTVRRANFLVSGLSLDNTTGGLLRIGDVVLKISGETDPCQRMEDQVAGLREALTPQWRGGVCCQVVTGGPVQPGADVVLERPPTSST